MPSFSEEDQEQLKKSRFLKFGPPERLSKLEGVVLRSIANRGDHTLVGPFYQQDWIEAVQSLENQMLIQRPLAPKSRLARTLTPKGWVSLEQHEEYTEARDRLAELEARFTAGNY